MTYVKINGNLYPANIEGKMNDREWDNRASKTIKLEMTHSEADSIFVDGLIWDIIMDVDQPQEDGSIITVQEEYDNSEFCVAGDITDHRDGTLSVKMGKFTTEEMLLMEVLA